MWQQTNPGRHELLFLPSPNDKDLLSPCDGEFWVKPVWMFHKVSLKRKQKFEAIMEIDDKIEKNKEDMEIDELEDTDEQYQEIDTDNKGESKTGGDIWNDTNVPVTGEEEAWEDNFQEAQIEENESNESFKQKMWKTSMLKLLQRFCPHLTREC